jgi:hypothetical protein
VGSGILEVLPLGQNVRYMCKNENVLLTCHTGGTIPISSKFRMQKLNSLLKYESCTKYHCISKTKEYKHVLVSPFCNKNVVSQPMKNNGPLILRNNTRKNRQGRRKAPIIIWEDVDVGALGPSSVERSVDGHFDIDSIKINWSL